MTTQVDPYTLYTRQEAADLLRINLVYLTQITKSGELHSIRVGRRRLIPRASLEAYIRGEREPRWDYPDVETDTPSLFKAPDAADAHGQS